MGYDKENILVIYESELQNIVQSSDNLINIDFNELQKLLIEKSFFHNRADAEERFDIKQIIPYLTVRRKNTEDNYEYFLLHRTKKQSEKRLHNLYSLGIGGHLNDKDAKTIGETIINGLYRELQEEIEIDYIVIPKFNGLIYSNIDDVSKCHIGLSFIFEIPNWVKLDIREKDKMTGNWNDLSSLKRNFSEMENWSRIVFDSINE